MIDFGPLDRAGKLYLRTYANGAGGVPVPTDTYARDFYATLQPATRHTHGSTLTPVAGRQANMGNPVFRTRYLEELATSNSYVLVIEGRTYKPIRIDEIGRREGLDIYMEDVR